MLSSISFIFFFSNVLFILLQFTINSNVLNGRSLPSIRKKYLCDCEFVNKWEVYRWFCGFSMAMTSQQYLNVPSSRLRTYYTIEHRHFVEGLLRVNVSHLGLLYASLNLKKKKTWRMVYAYFSNDLYKLLSCYDGRREIMSNLRNIICNLIRFLSSLFKIIRERKKRKRKRKYTNPEVQRQIYEVSIIQSFYLILFSINSRPLNQTEAWILTSSLATLFWEQKERKKKTIVHY